MCALLKRPELIARVKQRILPERFLMANFELPGNRSAAPVAVRDTGVLDTGVRDGLPFVAWRADASLFSSASWSRCAARALAAATPGQLCSADPAGAPGLRRQLADYLAKYRGIRCDPQDIVITTGIRHGLDLLLIPAQSRQIELYGSRFVGGLHMHRQFDLATLQTPGGDIAHVGLKLTIARGDADGKIHLLAVERFYFKSKLFGPVSAHGTTESGHR